MTRAYCTDGTPIDILKREAKSLKKALSIKLSEAQDRIAKNKGFDGWEALTSAAIHVDNDIGGHFCVTRRFGVDVIGFDIADMAENLGDYWRAVYARGGNMIPELYVSRTVYSNMDGNLRYEVFFQLSPSHNTWGIDPSPFVANGTMDDMVVAMEDILDENKPGFLIECLNDFGFLDVDPFDGLRHGEHEALLEIEMRKQGLHVGKRILFNCLDDRVERSGNLDHNRRCFPNLLSDGRVLVSNGEECLDTLLWTVLTRAEFDALQSEMALAFPGGPEFVFESEAWLHDRLFEGRPEGNPVTPILIRSNGSDDFEVISGYNRFLAACDAGKPFPVGVLVGHGRRYVVKYNPQNPNSINPVNAEENAPKGPEM